MTKKEITLKFSLSGKRDTSRRHNAAGKEFESQKPRPVGGVFHCIMYNVLFLRSSVALNLPC